ncbi:MAG: DUF1638 domain-containing protein [Actinomycetales bacterium]
MACGAIAAHIAEIVDRRDWPVDVHPLPPLLHNHPETIAAALERRIGELRPSYRTVAVGYADCGSYGGVDELCLRLGVERLRGSHCYDIFAGEQRLREIFEAQPGTYVLTDFLVRAFDRLVVQELGLDRHPELREDYFGNYTRVVWLAQRPDDELTGAADEAARRLGLPLEIVRVGDEGLERELRDLLGA